MGWRAAGCGQGSGAGPACLRARSCRPPAAAASASGCSRAAGATSGSCSAVSPPRRRGPAGAGTRGPGRSCCCKKPGPGGVGSGRTTVRRGELATRERPVVWVDERAERLSGPARKFDDLFLRLYPRLHDLCHRVVGDGFEAEDVVQEAFLRLAGAPVLDRPEEEVGAWLRRVCLNLSYNRLRWQRRARARLERAGRLEAGDGADPGDGPLGSVLRLEEQAAVRRALWA